MMKWLQKGIIYKDWILYTFFLGIISPLTYLFVSSYFLEDVNFNLSSLFAETCLFGIILFFDALKNFNGKNEINKELNKFASQITACFLFLTIILYIFSLHNSLIQNPGTIRTYIIRICVIFSTALAFIFDISSIH